MSVSFNTPLAFTILNSLFEARSYVAGYEVSDKDTEVFNALTEGPNEAAFPHAARWYKHVAEVKGLAAKAGAAPAAAAEEDDEDVDLFGSDDEEVDEEAEKIKQQRLAEYAAKKANKPKTIAKSMCTLDVKPWDDETDMAALEAHVRGITMDGLLWGQSKLVPIGYGIKKLQINCVIEDELVSLDVLEEKIMEGEDFIQSMDMAAMQKI
ncbi:Translation elongation factor 1 beta [Mortierella antarctica]|uniref:Translation elongation factor 1 beta n=1 Tax=Podila minutissima TaxID=64525 RepID=A0A9P5SGR3_9FUNG|nr:Translation elongation factor 1 beta [Mortierella antarctica]KAF9326705.1 Translation elongation factor 1 beta [Podila minutissima]KAG0358426.1 Translation elongation factor 1 beta [Podila minutissima]